MGCLSRCQCPFVYLRFLSVKHTHAHTAREETEVAVMLVWATLLKSASFHHQFNSRTEMLRLKQLDSLSLRLLPSSFPPGHSPLLSVLLQRSLMVPPSCIDPYFLDFLRLFVDFHFLSGHSLHLFLNFLGLCLCLLSLFTHNF